MQSAIRKRALQRKELEEAEHVSERISEGKLYFRDLFTDIWKRFVKQSKNL